MKATTAWFSIVAALATGLCIGCFSGRSTASSTAETPTARLYQPEQGPRRHTSNRFILDLTRQSGSNQMLLKAGVTDDEMRISREVEAARAAGKFVLKNEAPLFKKLQEYDFKTIASATMAKQRPEYDQVFRELGIDYQTAIDLQDHRAKIHRASLEAEAAISQVLEARFKYDAKIRGALSAESYQRYRDYESHAAARAELRQIETQTGMTIGLQEAQKEAIIKIIQIATLEAGGWWGWWHGPYDPLPKFVNGDEKVLAWAEDRLRTDRARTAKILSSIRNIVSEKEFTLVEKFYEERIDDRQRALASLNKVMAGKHARVVH